MWASIIPITLSNMSSLTERYKFIVSAIFLGAKSHNIFMSPVVSIQIFDELTKDCTLLHSFLVLKRQKWVYHTTVSRHLSPAAATIILKEAKYDISYFASFRIIVAAACDKCRETVVKELPLPCT